MLGTAPDGPLGTVTAVPDRPHRREVRDFLERLDPADVGGPMQAALVGAFQRLYHHQARRTWKDTWYRGTRLHAYPTDLWVYGELVEEVRPALVLQTGAFRGGTALLLADRLQTLGSGHVVAVAAEAASRRPEHPRLTWATGRPADPDVVREVRGRVDLASPVLALLGAGHTEEEVAAELSAYAPLLPVGSVLVVGHTHEAGPAAAVRAFLAAHDDYEADPRGERHFLTEHPAGILRRVRGVSSLAEDDAADHQRAGLPTRTAAPGATSAARRALGSLAFDGDRPSVVLVLQAFEPGEFFAGIRTAVLAAAHLADQTTRPLRVVVAAAARSSTTTEAREALVGLVSEAGLDAVAQSLRLSTPAEPDPTGHTEHDVWVATYWTTAVALRALTREGQVSADRVVYLIQDFEPGFYPWGPEFAEAYSTYDAGFLPLVNSSSLARYVDDLSPTSPEAVFAPALDTAPLHAAAERWRPADGDVVRVLFYARPGKPRNMYAAGVEALRSWAERLPDGVSGVVRFAGETLAEEVDLGPRARAEMLGKLTYDGYHDLLADTDVGLALMLSPHPGHLALELPLAGIPTVTNDFAGYRSPWVGGLRVSGTDPESIADALLEASETARGLSRHVPHEVEIDLGVSLEAAVAQVASSLAASSPGR